MRGRLCNHYMQFLKSDTAPKLGSHFAVLEKMPKSRQRRAVSDTGDFHLMVRKAIIPGLPLFVDVDFENYLLVRMFYLGNPGRHRLYPLDRLSPKLDFLVAMGIQLSRQVHGEQVVRDFIGQLEFFFGEDKSGCRGRLWMRTGICAVAKQPVRHLVCSSYVQRSGAVRKDVNPFAGRTKFSDPFSERCAL